MILKTQKQHEQKLLSLAKRCDSARISTYNVYAGIQPDGTNLGRKYGNKTFELLNILNGRDTKIIVGEPYHNECKENCLHCRRQHSEKLRRNRKHIRRWGNIDWRVVPKHHAKCYLFRTGNSYHGVIGGRNLSSSSFTDLSFVTTSAHSKQLWDLFDTWWFS